jgi:transposase
MWYAGLDWADTHHDVLIIDELGRQAGSLRIAHTPQGMAQLNAFLEQILANAPKEQMACIVETTHGLLIAFLLEAGWPVYPVNPRTVDRKRSASGAKTDRIDAYLLAKTGRADLPDLHRLTPDSAKVAELKQLTRDQDTLIQMRTRLVNQLTACLKAYYPVALELFGKLQQRSTLVFLQTYPTPAAVMAASAEQILQTLKSTRYPQAAKTARLIIERVHQPHLIADAVLTRTKSRLMVVLVSQLLPLVEQIAAYDKEIEALFLTHEDHALFRSLPRAGKHLAPRLLAEIGDDRQRYQDAGSLQKLGGTAPVLYESGNYSRITSPTGLYQAVAQCLAAICVADHQQGSMGQSLLSAETKGRKEPYRRCASTC